MLKLESLSFRQLFFLINLSLNLNLVKMRIAVTKNNLLKKKTDWYIMEKVKP
ncbi:MAG: hypothetical protein PVH61_25785 [Candidatus Aminicenantes bacterium]